VKVKLRIVYPTGYVEKPILAEAILATGIKMNILEATLDARSGELIASLEAEEAEVERLVGFLRDRGVKVERIVGMLKVDKDRCIDCGACVSICPVQAIEMGEDWVVRFDEDRCVGCGACVRACPMKAVTLV